MRKWQLLLPLAGILLNVFLFWLAIRQYDTIHRLRPGVFYEGSTYVAPALQAAYCINAPAFVVSSLIQDFFLREFDWTGAWLHTGDLVYYLCVIVLWWWIGLRVDRSDSNASNKTKPLLIAVQILGLCFAVFLIYVGLSAHLGLLLHTRFVPTRAIAVSIRIWGLGLACCFLASLIQLWRSRPQHLIHGKA
jgi:hypothetical protein